jgi:rhodanese-related sulfurtransferase
MKKFYMYLLIFMLLIAFITIYLFQKESNSLEEAAWSQINQNQMMEEIKKEHVQIVDLREPELYINGHITNAINIPFVEFEKRYLELDKERPVIFVCHTGPMGDATSQLIVTKGFKDVANLKKGMAGWTGPLEKE